MGHKSTFYFECLKYAWRGSIEFANAWASILGALAVWMFSWFTGVKVPLPDSLLMNVGLTLVFLLAGWVVTFLFRLCLAPAKLYESQAKTIETYQEKEKPKLAIRFIPESKKEGHHFCETRTHPETKKDTKLYKIGVLNSSDENAIDCKITVLSVKDKNGKPYERYGESLRPTGREGKNFSIHGNEEKFFQFVCYYKADADYLNILYAEDRSQLPIANSPYEVILNASGHGRSVKATFCVTITDENLFVRKL